MTYGVTDEWHQAFVPFREPDRWDLAADLLGTLGSVLASVWVDRKKPQAWDDGAHLGAERRQTGIG